MLRSRSIVVLVGVSALVLVGARAADDELPIEHADCPFFGPDHDRFLKGSLRGFRNGKLVRGPGRRFAASALTEAVTSSMPPPPPGTRTGSLIDPATSNTIDRYLFQAMAEANVKPAPATTDFEFARRVTLDLTGHIPTVDQLSNFINDSSSDKRSKYIESLLSSSQWLDKWTLYFGDFFQNNSQNTQITRTTQGVLAFNTYIRSSLAANKPYDQMAREMISAAGNDAFTKGELNWLAGGVVGGGPTQDVYDQQTANVATTFLALANLNCILCHNGRGHLDQLNLWGAQTTRQQAWGMSSFISRTVTNSRGAQTGAYQLLDTGATDYALNTTTGNRPARQPVGTLRNIAPAYMFGGQKPAANQPYRVALAQYVTSDFQFARAAVNYMWAQFFGMGIVDPPDQFDPARLDPDNPPEVPWPADTSQPWPLQPSNPQLLNALAQDFINSHYDLKALMREIASSNAYQLSSRYEGTWSPEWESLFARKLVRRLWAEELHDAVTQSSGNIPSYNLGAVFGATSSALQLPEPRNTPDGGAVRSFLDAFLRGNRDDQPRHEDGSILQTLDLMNDSFVMNRVQMSRAPKGSLLPSAATQPNDRAIDTLFLSVLSRYPTAAEKAAAMAHLGNASTRNQELENLLWSLYNKVDFIFNY
jgi:hypothetical protein